MTFDFRFSSLAEKNIEDATDYYAQISVKVLKNFNKQLDFSISRIITNPYFQKRFNSVRAFPVKKFPYIIFYEVSEEEKMIYILRFLHPSESGKISIKSNNKSNK